MAKRLLILCPADTPRPGCVCGQWPFEINNATAEEVFMKNIVFLLAAVLVLTSGCIRLKAGYYPEPYKADFQGWFKGYASYKVCIHSP